MAAEQSRGDVLITGASTGIGAACALHLDQLGFRVFAGVRQAADGAALRSKASTRISHVVLDVTDPASIAAARESVARATSGLAVWSTTPASSWQARSNFFLSKK